MMVLLSGRRRSFDRLRESSVLILLPLRCFHVEDRTAAEEEEDSMDDDELVLFAAATSSKVWK